MPTYEYRCESCEHEFEEFQSITASPMKKCPECGKMKLRRLVGVGAGIIFKGSGFYETDYRSDSYRKAAKAEKDNGSSSSESDSKKSDKGKSETKADSGSSSKSESKPAKSGAKASKKEK